MKKMIINIIALGIVYMISGCQSDSGTSDVQQLQSNTNANAELIEESLQTKIRITHPKGETDISINPKKVIVFDFGSLDTLDFLGVDVLGIPKSNVPNYLVKYKDDANVIDVGTLQEPNFEKINELEPDLILISSRQAESYDELSNLAPTIYVPIDNSDYMESLKLNANILGKIFNKESSVLNELELIDKKIDTLSNTIEEKNITGLIVMYSEGKFQAYGSKSRFGIILDVLKFKEADLNRGEGDIVHGLPVSAEYIVEQNPDYLFVIDRNTLIDDVNKPSIEEIENELIRMTDAYKNGNIIYLDLGHWYLSGGGLVSINKMISDIETAIK
jgi:iron complex transport system substrate-binding protein